MTAVRAYVAAAILLLPIGACLEWSARSGERIGLEHVDDGPTPVFQTGCGLSAESCELP